MSLPRYSEYKESGVPWLGEVPAHWSIVPLGTLSTSIQTGPFGSQLHSEDYVDDETPVINPSNIQNGKLVADASCTVPAHIVERLSEHKLFTGDIVFARRGEMGRCAMVTASEAGWICGTGSLNVRLGDKALAEFVSDFLGTPHVKELLKLESVGSTMDNLNTAILSHVQVPTPPLEEQSAIAAFLDRETGKIDALIAEQEKLLTLLAEKRQATISHAVTSGLNPNAPMKDSGVPWLGEVPIHWDVVCLRRIARNVETGSTPSSDSPSSDLEDGVLWYTPGDFGSDLVLNGSQKKVAKSLVGSGEVKIFPLGSILIVSIGATLGKVGLSNSPAAANQQINAVILDESMDDRFFAYSLSAKVEVMRFLSNASTIGIMNQSRTKEIQLAVPPEVEQIAIATHLDGATAKIALLEVEAERAIAILKERRSALIAAAVTGKIDVRQAA